MANTNAFELQHSDLNGFLFADIGIEAGGMELSVVSALAREGVDPWQEAARLAKLPWAIAVDELARMIAGMPASLWPQPAATEIATRLVRMLPGREGGASTASRRIDAAGLFGSSSGAGTGSQGGSRGDSQQSNRTAAKTGLKPELLIVFLLGLAILVGSAIGLAHAPQPALQPSITPQAALSSEPAATFAHTPATLPSATIPAAQPPPAPPGGD
jgi:hypothetical protein